MRRGPSLDQKVFAEAAKLLPKIRALAARGSWFRHYDDNVKHRGRSYKLGSLVIRDYFDTDSLGTSRLVEVTEGDRLFFSAAYDFDRRVSGRHSIVKDDQFEILGYACGKWTSYVKRAYARERA